MSVIIMRASRLLSILFLLHQKRRLTASQLAKEYEVSVRTIYRDIDELSAAGIPIYGDSGPGGGFELLDNYKVKPIGFFDDEVKAYFPFFQKNIFDSLGLSQNANTAFNKIISNLPNHQKEIANKNSGKIFFDPNPWYFKIENPIHLKELAKAIFENKKIQITYSSWNKTSEKIIEPLGLVLKSNEWYLIGKNNKILLYKVANIQVLEILNTSFENIDFNIEDFWINSIKKFEQNLRPLKVKILADEIALNNIRKIGEYAEKSYSKRIYFENINTYEIDLDYENDNQIIRLLLSIEGKIIIKEPLELKKKLLTTIENIKKLNQ